MSWDQIWVALVEFKCADQFSIATNPCFRVEKLQSWLGIELSNLNLGSHQSAFDLPALPTPLTKILVKTEFVILVSLGKYFDESSDAMTRDRTWVPLKEFKCACYCSFCFITKSLYLDL